MLQKPRNLAGVMMETFQHQACIPLQSNPPCDLVGLKYLISTKVYILACTMTRKLDYTQYAVVTIFVQRPTRQVSPAPFTIIIASTNIYVTA